MELEKLREVIAGVLNVDPKEITLETTFLEDLGADSLDVVEMCLELEEKFDIQFETEELSNFKTIGDLFASIEKKLN